MISIVIPCYNQGPYLLEAIDSAYQQSVAKDAYEILVVDDCSTEQSTLDVVSKVGAPAVVLKTPQNLGTAGARNYGIAQARGEWILPLDADDKLAPTFLERVLETRRDHPEAGIIFGEVEFFGGRHGKWNLQSFGFPGFLIQNSIVSCASYRRSDWERVGGYCEDFIHGMEDHDFWMSLIESGCLPFQVPEVHLYYRQTNDSRTKRMTVSQKKRASALLFERHQTLYQEYGKELFMELMDRELRAPNGNANSFVAQLFYPDISGHSEERSIRVHGICGENLELAFVIPNDWVGPLRFDPCSRPARVKLAHLKLQSASGATLYELSEDPLEHLGIQGTACVTESGQEAGVLISDGDDPQLVLQSQLSGKAGSRLTVRLCVMLDE